MKAKAKSGIWIAIFLLLLSLATATTKALTGTLTVDGTPVAGSTSSGPGWSYDDGTGTLTLNGYNGGAISADGTGPLTIALAPGTTNTVTSNQVGGIGGIYTETSSPLTIKGSPDAVLNVTAPNGGVYGVGSADADSPVTIDNAHVNITGFSFGIGAGSTLKIVNGSDVTTDNNTKGVTAHGDVLIDHSRVTSRGNTDISISSGGDVTIQNGSTVNVAGGAFDGIIGANVNISGGTVNATTKGGYSIYGDRVNISGGTIVAPQGIQAGRTVITGGSLDAPNVLVENPFDANGKAALRTDITLRGAPDGTQITSITGVPSGYGTNDIYTDSASTIYPWFPSGNTVTKVTDGDGNTYIGSVLAGTDGVLKKEIPPPPSTELPPLKPTPPQPIPPTGDNTVFPFGIPLLIAFCFGGSIFFRRRYRDYAK